MYLSVNGSADVLPDDLKVLKEAIEAGGERAVIDRVYTLEQIVEAHRPVQAGHEAGNVVISVR